MPQLTHGKLPGPDARPTSCGNSRSSRWLLGVVSPGMAAKSRGLQICHWKAISPVCQKWRQLAVCVLAPGAWAMPVPCDQAPHVSLQVQVWHLSAILDCKNLVPINSVEQACERWFHRVWQGHQLQSPWGLWAGSPWQHNEKPTNSALQWSCMAWKRHPVTTHKLWKKGFNYNIHLWKKRKQPFTSLWKKEFLVYQARIATSLWEKVLLVYLDLSCFTLNCSSVQMPTCGMKDSLFCCSCFQFTSLCKKTTGKNCQKPLRKGSSVSPC